MVSQNATPSKKQFGGALPYVFTENGVSMLSSVLKSKTAINVTKQIMRTFTKLKNQSVPYFDIIKRLEKLEFLYGVQVSNYLILKFMFQKIILTKLSFYTTIVSTKIKKGILLMKQAINIRLEKDILGQLDEYASELEKTRTNLIEKAIEFYFDKLDEMVADKRIDNLKSGKTKVVPLEVVFAQAGINV